MPVETRSQAAARGSAGIHAAPSYAMALAPVAVAAGAPLILAALAASAPASAEPWLRGAAYAGAAGCMAALLWSAAGRRAVAVMATPRAIFPVWMAVWLCLTAAHVAWDAAYVLLWPLSATHALWYPYQTGFVTVGLGSYAWPPAPGMDVGEYGALMWGLAVMNIVEFALYALALWLMLSGREAVAVVLALVVTTMTWSKTVLYCLADLSDGLDPTGLTAVYLVPNAIRVLMYGVAAHQLGAGLVRSISRVDLADAHTRAKQQAGEGAPAEGG